MTDHTNPLAPIEALADNWARGYPSLVIAPQLHAALDEARQAVDALVAERDAAREALARVETLADEYATQAAREGYGGELWSTTESAIRAALAESANPDVGERCGECRLGLGVHRPSDPRCRHHVAQPATDEEAE